MPSKYFYTSLWLLLLLHGCCLTAVSQQANVMVMDIKAEIDPRMTRYVQLALSHAEETHADVIIIEMDTYGGVLTDAKDIVDKISAVKVPVWVFINSDAASAGALISISCDSIYMAPGASIGAATVVDGNGEKAPDKYQSYMRSIMRSVAEVHGRNPLIAEGMVDEEVEIDSVKKPGKIVTLSTMEAIRYGYCEAQVNSVQNILDLNGLSGAHITHFEPGALDRIITFFLNPMISSILILIILGGIYFELQSPGIGIAGLAALVGLALYLIPYYMNGLAEYWEIILFLAGISLIALEVFVIPGFGFAGIAGIVTTLLSLVLIMINNDAFDFEFVRMNDILIAMISSVGGLLGGVILLFVVASRLPETQLFKRVALTDTQQSKEGYNVNFNTELMIGKRGRAHTVLRPSGKVIIGDRVYDAFTKGEYVDAGQSIEVILETGSSLQVKSVQESHA